MKRAMVGGANSQADGQVKVGPARMLGRFPDGVNRDEKLSMVVLFDGTQCALRRFRQQSHEQ
ncbi:uncharacterized protein ColSpa_07507 [Colletotrichum spaethianum]|uniref:Uncharacterized protein n=1 Tax=Colletotrichum spaethianum TaxID=700344 RepID=A0AA37LFE8_9PEZI|nr:uncharacterized protein ColSpa_07507 [Colletotrichum spaethianum]GKT47326.1 hypothetical protein ColSpa_07507 [Colletotrichum spaethianum]